MLADLHCCLHTLYCTVHAVVLGRRATRRLSVLGAGSSSRPYTQFRTANAHGCPLHRRDATLRGDRCVRTMVPTCFSSSGYGTTWRRQNSLLRRNSGFSHRSSPVEIVGSSGVPGGTHVRAHRHNAHVTYQCPLGPACVFGVISQTEWDGCWQGQSSSR